MCLKSQHKVPFASSNCTPHVHHPPCAIDTHLCSGVTYNHAAVILENSFQLPLLSTEVQCHSRTCCDGAAFVRAATITVVPSLSLAKQCQQQQQYQSWQCALFDSKAEGTLLYRSSAVSVSSLASSVRGNDRLLEALCEVRLATKPCLLSR